MGFKSFDVIDSTKPTWIRENKMGWCVNMCDWILLFPISVLYVSAHLHCPGGRGGFYQDLNPPGYKSAKRSTCSKSFNLWERFTLHYRAFRPQPGDTEPPEFHFFQSYFLVVPVISPILSEQLSKGNLWQVEEFVQVCPIVEILRYFIGTHVGNTQNHIIKLKRIVNHSINWGFIKNWEWKHHNTYQTYWFLEWIQLSKKLLFPDIAISQTETSLCWFNRSRGLGDFLTLNPFPQKGESLTLTVTNTKYSFFACH